MLSRLPQRQRRPPRRAGRMQAHRPPRHPCRTANRSLPHRRAVLLRHFSQ
nr:MAG TPA: hypothetical protein [Caudoviricetes sp.]